MFLSMTRGEAIKDSFCKVLQPVAAAALLLALNFNFAKIIGGFVLAWRLIVVVWYVPLAVWKLISL